MTTQNRYYAGVGARQTPPDVLALMKRAAVWLRGRGWTLRSGHAQGADQAFEEGAGKDAISYLPWHGFEREVDFGGRLITLAEPILLECYDSLVEMGIRYSRNGVKTSVKLLHGRNYLQVMGPGTPDCPASLFVLCWAPLDAAGKPQGGTATAINLARRHSIKVINLVREEECRKLEQRMQEAEA